MIEDKVYQFRSYQQEAIDAIDNKLKAGISKQLVVMATGLGKTYIATQQSLKYNKILFVAHREELIDQAAAVMDQFHPMQIGIIKAKRFEIDKKVVVASVQTLTNRLDKIDPELFDFIIIDEIHHYAAATYIRVVKHFRSKLLLGLTATPHRLDGLSLGNLVDEIIYDYGIDKGVKDGWLCELDAFRIRTDTDLSKVKRVGGDFNKKELQIKVDSPERNELIVKKYEQYAKDRQTIVFATGIDHAIHLTEAFIKAGHSASYVVSDEKLTPERREVIRRFREGKITVLVNVMILSEGFDHLDVGCIAMARPTESLTVYIQAIGRGTRPKTETFIERHKKNNCIILDFVDNSGKHKLINTWSLDKGKDPKDMTFMSKERRVQLAIKIANERKMLMKVGADRKINLLKLPKIKLRTDRGGFLAPASDKQLAWLKSEGVWQEGVEYTKGQATEYITNFAAKDWQVRKLVQWGYEIDDNNFPTQGQYYEVKKKMDEQKTVSNYPKPRHVPFENIKR